MSNPIPQIFDTGRRVARTIVQAALAVVSIAPVYPLIVTAIGAPAGSNVGLWLAASVTWIGTVAGVISRVMAIPAVNGLLTRAKLGGHSGNVTASDNLTGYIATITPAAAAAAAAGTPAH